MGDLIRRLREAAERGEHLGSKGISWDDPESTPWEDMVAVLSERLGLHPELAPWQEKFLRECSLAVLYGQGIVQGTDARGNPIFYAQGGPHDPDVQQTPPAAKSQWQGYAHLLEWADEIQGWELDKDLQSYNGCPTTYRQEREGRWLNFVSEPVRRA